MNNNNYDKLFEEAKNITELKRRDKFLNRIYKKIVPEKIRMKLRGIENTKLLLPIHNKLRSFRLNVLIPLKAKLNLPIKKPRKKLLFEIQLAEHCNLNCKGCAHFSSIAEPEFLNVEEFERDAKRLGELTGHECDEIRLMGGEPLLHPEIIKIMKIARENFSEGVIDIVTNGILLTRMGDEFWQTCHDYKIYIKISHYPIEIHADKIKEIAEKFGVTCFWDRIGLKDEFIIYAIDLKGREKFARNFYKCGQANQCITLGHGRLYPCPFALHVRHFNKKFNKNIVVTEDDSVDIYANLTKEEIFKKLAKAIQVCRFCKIMNLKTTNWGISKGDIREWGIEESDIK